MVVCPSNIVFLKTLYNVLTFDLSSHLGSKRRTNTLWWSPKHPNKFGSIILPVIIDPVIIGMWGSKLCLEKNISTVICSIMFQTSEFSSTYDHLWANLETKNPRDFSSAATIFHRQVQHFSSAASGPSSTTHLCKHHSYPIGFSWLLANHLPSPPLCDHLPYSIDFVRPWFTSGPSCLVFSFFPF